MNSLYLKLRLLTVSNIDSRAATALAGHNLFVKQSQSMGRPNFRLRVRLRFTDHVGGDQYNLRLSVRRPIAVRQFYVENGIA